MTPRKSQRKLSIKLNLRDSNQKSKGLKLKEGNPYTHRRRSNLMAIPKTRNKVSQRVLMRRLSRSLL